MAYIPKNLPPELSFANRWRSFLRHFDETWDRNFFPPDDVFVSYSARMTEEERAKATTAKAVVVFQFNSFAGGRGDLDDQFSLTVAVKREHNVFDVLMLDIINAIQDVYEMKTDTNGIGSEGIPLYDHTKVPPEKVVGGGDSLFPIFVGAEDTAGGEAEDEGFDVMDVIFSVASDRSSKLISSR